MNESSFKWLLFVVTAIGAVFLVLFLADLAKAQELTRIRPPAIEVDGYFWTANQEICFRVTTDRDNRTVFWKDYRYGEQDEIDEYGWTPIPTYDPPTWKWWEWKGNRWR